MEKALIELIQHIKLQSAETQRAFKWDLTKTYLRMAAIPGAMGVVGIIAFAGSLDQAIPAGIWAANTVINFKMVLTEFLQYRRVMKEFQ